MRALYVVHHGREIAFGWWGRFLAICKELIGGTPLLAQKAEIAQKAQKAQKAQQNASGPTLSLL
jgi:uncharacterized membrane protein